MINNWPTFFYFFEDYEMFRKQSGSLNIFATLHLQASQYETKKIISKNNFDSILFLSLNASCKTNANIYLLSI